MSSVEQSTAASVGACLFTFTAAAMTLILSSHRHRSGKRKYRRKLSATISKNSSICKGNSSEAAVSSILSHPSGYLQLIGNTPLIELHSLSRATGCRFLVKVESANPGGSGKDRAAKNMLLTALRRGELKAHTDGVHHIVEGTSGSTGISLANIIRSMSSTSNSTSNSAGSSSSTGSNCIQPMQFQLHVVLPDDQAPEKRALLEKLGARVVIVPTAAISNPNHYINVARRLAASLNGFFVNQFENLANYEVHYNETGPELYQQVKRRLLAEQNETESVVKHGQERHSSVIDLFVMSAGTGGTIAGIASYLKSTRNTLHLQRHCDHDNDSESDSESDSDDSLNTKRSTSNGVHVVLADPTGSSLASRVSHGVCYTTQQQERKVRRHRYDTIVEGVGLDRLTANFSHALKAIDAAMTVADQDILNTAHNVLRDEGIMLGSSSALNITVAYRIAQQKFGGKCKESKHSTDDHSNYFLGRPTIVTVLCDSGTRHLSRFWNPDYIAAPPYSLSWPAGTPTGTATGAAEGTGAEPPQGEECV